MRQDGLMKDGGEDSFANGVKGGTVDVGHVVMAGMPISREACARPLIVVYDVDARDAGDGVDVVMVVGERVGGCVTKEVTIAQLLSGFPYLIYIIGGILHGEIFAWKISVRGADHVEENAVGVGRDFLVGGGGSERSVVVASELTPELAAEAPCVLALEAIVEVRRAHIFYVEEDDVDAWQRYSISTEQAELTRHLKEDADAGCAIVGTENRGHAVVISLLLVRPRATIPMGAEQNGGLVGWAEMTAYIDDVLVLTSIVDLGALLNADRGSKTTELLCEVMRAVFVCDTTGHAWSEIDLLGNVLVCRISGESR